MASIFNIPKTINQLVPSNPGMARGCSVGSNFAQGRNIQFRWMFGGTTWFLPSMSYFKIRCTLTQVRGNNEPILSSADLSPNMGLAANLLQSMEVRVNGVPIERVGERLPQIDALKTRLSHGKSWLANVGASVHFWDFNRPKKNSRNDAFRSTRAPGS